MVGVFSLLTLFKNKKTRNLILVLVLLTLVFIPNSVYGGKNLIFLYSEDCDVICVKNVSLDSSYIMNFVLIGMMALVGIGVINLRRLKKFETFSLRCKNCNRFTCGFKCQFCNSDNH